jgi:hypothetical protein
MLVPSSADVLSVTVVMVQARACETAAQTVTVCLVDQTESSDSRTDSEGDTAMMAALVLTGEGPVVVLTRYTSLEDAGFIDQLKRKGIRKFIAFKIPLDLARERYGHHFDAVMSDIHETDEMRTLDFLGSRAFELFRFDELSEPTFYEAPSEKAAPEPGRREVAT